MLLGKESPVFMLINMKMIEIGSLTVQGIVKFILP